LGGKGGRCVRLTTLPPSCAVVMKSGNLSFLEPSGPLQACNGTALPFTVYALHVSGGFSAHHQELKNCTHSIWYVPDLLATTASVVELELNHASGSSKQAWHIPDAVCTVLELLMMGEETDRNMYSIDSNKEYHKTLHLVGCT